VIEFYGLHLDIEAPTAEVAEALALESPEVQTLIDALGEPFEVYVKEIIE
jgi:hypothetical protein